MVILFERADVTLVAVTWRHLSKSRTVVVNDLYMIALTNIQGINRTSSYSSAQCATWIWKQHMHTSQYFPSNHNNHAKSTPHARLPVQEDWPNFPNNVSWCEKLTESIPTKTQIPYWDRIVVVAVLYVVYLYFLRQQGLHGFAWPFIRSLKKVWMQERMKNG